MTTYEPKGLAEDIFLQRYVYPGEKTWAERAKVIAKTAASVEKDQDKIKIRNKFYEVISSGDFVPGGRIIFGSGRSAGRHNLLNCYVIIPDDSVASIGKTIQDMYKISCAGGGIGFNFSKIRPKGDRIQNIEYSAPGSVSVMKMINEIGNHVRAGKNRRTALMGILDVTHPDLFEFLHVKLSAKELINFNISVAITDRFLEAIDLDEDWYFSFANRKYFVYKVPVYFKGQFQRDVRVVALDEVDAVGRVKQHFRLHADEEVGSPETITIKAKQIWDLIFKNSVESGDPGIYNKDLANRLTNVSYFEELNSTNPCLKKGSLVHTPDGYKKVEDIKVGDEITTVEGIARPVQRIETHESIPIFAVTFSDGSEQICTAAHKFYAVKGTGKNQFWEQISLKNLSKGDTVRVATAQMPNNPVPLKPEKYSDRDYGFILGTVLGDGCFTEKSKGLKLSSSIEEKEWNTLLENVFGSCSKDYHFDSRGRQTKSISLLYGENTNIVNTLKKSLIPKCKAIYKYIPLEYINTNRAFLSGILDGLFSTDGTVNLKGNLPHIRFTSGSKRLALDVKRILAMFGIHGRIYEQERKEHEYDGRKIKSNSLKYDVWINSGDILTFHNEVKLSHPEKRNKIKHAAIFGKLGTNTRRTKIVNIEPVGEDTVYDLYEPITDTWISEGIVSQGCGEISLPSYGNCCLGNINLANMVTGGEFEWVRFDRAVKIGVQFLDNILETNFFPTEECKEVALRSRRIGLGVLGYHYMLIKLGMRYGSEESIEFTERLFKRFRDVAYIQSMYLSRDKAPFSAFNASKFLNEEFAKKLPARIRMEIKKNGIRNAVLLTIPPTGTISMLMGVSSGIEPIFAAMYKRRFRVDSTWKETVVIDPMFREHILNGGNPELFVGAYDVTPEEHLKVQAAIQPYIDSCISKTINLPKEYTWEELSNTALEYIRDLKGLTIYRAGSKEMEPLEAIPLTKENIDNYFYGNIEAATGVAVGDACSIAGGEC